MDVAYATEVVYASSVAPHFVYNRSQAVRG